jgi:predicted GH43/DUF377 family glycosyl hydrolase
MKLHSLILALFGSIYCHAAIDPNPSSLTRDIFDYPLIEEPAPAHQEAPPATSPMDLDEMIRDFVLETKKIEIPGHPFACNSSFTRWKGNLLMSFRTYDLVTRATKPFGLIWLNENFEPIGEPQLFELPFKNPVLASRQQDPRLITLGDRLFMVYNNQLEDVVDREMRRMFLVEVYYDGSTFTTSEPECLRHFEGESGTRYEKNWTPFEYNNELHLAYSIIPHKILRPRMGTNACSTICSERKPFNWNWGEPRGGTQAVLDGDHYISFFHSWTDIRTVQSDQKKISHYFIGAYTFEAKPPFCLIAVSPEPIVAKDFYRPPFYKTWKPLRCVFPAGLIVDKDFIWITYGRQDHEIWIAKIDKEALLESLVPVSTE